ncbi:MAG: hypothetical protein V9E98_02635, partial [Candidatus Nanopelagicales bacterium]
DRDLLRMSGDSSPVLLTVMVSIGVTELRPDDDFDAWLDLADQALHRAKSAGRTTVRSRD